MELAAARDADHDPAGMHKAADTERQMMQELYGGQVISVGLFCLYTRSLLPVY